MNDEQRAKISEAMKKRWKQRKKDAPLFAMKIVEELTEVNSDDNPVSHPAHYTSHPSGVECIQITEHMNFNVGNAIKYLWRAGEKGSYVEQLEKAKWYIEREIQRVSPRG